MKINNSAKLLLYIILFVAFLLVRINHSINTQGVFEIDLKSLAIASTTFPFGIIKNTAIHDFFSPIYYLLIHFFVVLIKSDLLIRIINSTIAFLNIILIVNIGKKLLNTTLGIFLGLFLCFNQFFLFYTHQIAPYCLSFLVGTLLINAIIDFLRKPDDKTCKKLTIFNCMFIICDSLGFLYVLAELIILFLLGEKSQNIKKLSIKLAYHAFITFLVMFVFFLIQYAKYTKMLIPANYNGIGLNLNGIYLMLNEYITPYLSFSSGEFQAKSTLGMLYSFFLNPDLKNINSLKIAITLFYSSILPLFAIFILSIKALLKEYKLKILFFISFINLLFILMIMLNGKMELHPIFATQFFITGIIILGYGIFKIKDNFIKCIIVFCLFAIQIITPEFDSFNITIKKQYPVANVFNNFAQDYHLSSNDYIIMPHMGKFAKMYYKNLNFADLDYSMLQTNGKDKIIKNLNNKKAKTMNKNNLLFLLSDYLRENKTNEFLTKYFLQNCIENKALDENYNRIILVIDKLNTRPVSKGAIIKCANSNEYNARLRKIDFANLTLEKNKTKILFDALRAKTLYNFIDLLSTNFYIENIVEYKKIDDDYYKTENNSSNIYQAINSYNSDYIFIIFTKLK